METPMLNDSPVSLPLPLKPRYRREEASLYLMQRHGISRTPGTLACLATKGGGPAMEYDGRTPLYTPAALDEWAAGKLSAPVRSTSERNGSRRRGAATRTAHA